MVDLFRLEMEILQPHIEDTLRSESLDFEGDTEMNATDGMVQFFAIVAMWVAINTDILSEEMDDPANIEAWYAAIDAHSERYKAVPVHTEAHPYCLQSDCPCHDDEEEVDAEFIKHQCVCGGCGNTFFASADDIAWKFEASPFMSCGCPWDMLDKSL